MRVASVAEALLADVVGEAGGGDVVEDGLGLDDAGGLDAADLEDKAVPAVVASAELVGVALGPEHFDLGVVLDAFDGLRLGGDVGLGQVDGDVLAGDGVLVFEARVADVLAADAEVLSDALEQLHRGQLALLDVEVEVLALAGGLVERLLFDEEVLGALFEDATDAGVVGVEVGE